MKELKNQTKVTFTRKELNYLSLKTEGGDPIFSKFLVMWMKSSNLKGRLVEPPNFEFLPYEKKMNENTQAPAR